MITVLIVDDHPLQRIEFRMQFESDPDTQVVGEAANGEAAVMLVGLMQPDVVLMDIRSRPERHRSDTSHPASGAPSRVLVTTTLDADEYVHAALRARASGFFFLLKNARPEEVLQASALWPSATHSSHPP